MSPKKSSTRRSDGSRTPSVTWTATEVTTRPLAALTPYAANPRAHPDKQIELLVRSIQQFGFVNPVLIDAAGNIIAGHGRFEAARRLGLATVPTVQLDHLTPAQLRAYRIADNRIAELSDWDEEVLRLEIADLVELELTGELEFDLGLTGFSTPQIDVILDGPANAAAAPQESLELPAVGETAVSRKGDLWILGRHRLYCGDALDPGSREVVMAGESARMVFTDPPYNVPIAGHVRTGTGNGHREFAMAVGEMDAAAFRSFLQRAIAQMRDACCDGAILMICMDWRHIADLVAAGEAEGLRLINLCVWNKTNGGMGSLYRSQHELVAIFKTGREPHVNNVELGRHGRYRTNVWDYAGVNTFRRGRGDDLADHPTVKPTALVADAIRDVSHHDDIVLDVFGGSGATLLAAQKTGRRARLIELDPLYVDVAIRRWQALTGQEAVHAETGESFAARAESASVAVGHDPRAPIASRADPPSADAAQVDAAQSDTAQAEEEERQ